MFNVFIVLILIVSVLLVLVVLVQNSKGGGLDPQFSNNNQFMGVRKTTDFIEKATWGLAIGLVVLSIMASVFAPSGKTMQKSRISDQVNQVNQTIPTPAQNTPTTEEVGGTEETTTPE